MPLEAKGESSWMDEGARVVDLSCRGGVSTLDTGLSPEVDRGVGQWDGPSADAVAMDVGRQQKPRSTARSTSSQAAMQWPLTLHHFKIIGHTLHLEG